MLGSRWVPTIHKLAFKHKSNVSDALEVLVIASLKLTWHQLVPKCLQKVSLGRASEARKTEFV